MTISKYMATEYGYRCDLQRMTEKVIMAHTEVCWVFDLHLVPPVQRIVEAGGSLL